MPQGTYFVQADVAPLGVGDAASWCRELPERAGIVAIATSALYDDEQAGRTLVRFAFCKRPAVLEEAVARLTALRPDRLRSRAMALSGTASTDIDAPIETVWAIVQDVESAPAWQRGIGATDALARHHEGRATCCETLTDLNFKVFNGCLSFSYFPPEHLSWEQEQGDLKSLHGSWRLVDLGEGPPARRTRWTLTPARCCRVFSRVRWRRSCARC